MNFFGAITKIFVEVFLYRENAGAWATSSRNREVVDSLSAFSAFIGFLALASAAMSWLLLTKPTNSASVSVLPMTSIAAGSILGAYFACRAGRRASVVSHRLLGLAKLGIVLSLVAIGLATLAFLLAIVRLSS